MSAAQPIDLRDYPAIRAHLEAERDRLGYWIGGPHFLTNLTRDARVKIERLHRELVIVVGEKDAAPPAA